MLDFCQAMQSTKVCFDSVDLSFK